jgi:tetratricopeptide (TPR) repeat protein
MAFIVLLCGFGLLFGFLVIFKGKEAKARRRAREILDKGQIDDREEVNRLTAILGSSDMDDEAQHLCKKLLELRSSATSMRFSPLQETVDVEAKAQDMIAKADVFVAEKRDQDREEKRPARDSGYDLLSVAEEGRKKLESSGAPPEQYDEVLSIFEAALAMGISPFKQAIVHRRIGEIHHRCGRDADAIRHLEIAVRLNPKVGAKRLLDSLRKGYPSAPL